MRRNLTTAEITNCNQLISKAQVLINARGRHSGLRGRYEGQGFLITFGDTVEMAELLISHHGRRVFKATWEAANAPCRVVQSPGTWSDALLALPAEHA
jgi:hypothetical protein